MSDLVEFLRARLDEDEQAVQAVLGVNVMAGLKGGKPAPRWVPSPKADGGIWDTDGIPRVKFVWARERDHIIRHDPARVLADVDAKRRILELHGRMSITPQHPLFNDAHLTKEPMVICRSCEPETMWRRERSWPCRTLRALALPWAGHPDYRPEWSV